MRLCKVILGLVTFFVAFFLVIYLFFRSVDQIESNIHERFMANVEEYRRLQSKKIILLYNHLYDPEMYPIMDSYCLDPLEVEQQREACPYSCFFTDDKSAIQYAHALVFSARNLKTNRTTREPLDMPPRTNEDQRWILLQMDSPPHPKFVTRTRHIIENDVYYPALDQLFNWTMSYRHDADIRVPYGRVLSKIPRHEGVYSKGTFDSYKSLPGKARIVAWISSHCEIQNSGRTQLVAQLQKYMPVDTYGNCGQFQCPLEAMEPHAEQFMCESIKLCYKYISYYYKFYLALETSLCDEYVTEKFFSALEFGMVPVVYGKVNYSDIAIPGSFIDVQDFESVKELAEYLLHLHRHPEEYLKYFEWRKYAVVTTTFHLRLGWCTLCAKLWEADQPLHLIPMSALNDSDLRKGGDDTVPAQFNNENFTSHVFVIKGREDRDIVGLDTLNKYWAESAFNMGICETPPTFIANSSGSYSIPRDRRPFREAIQLFAKLKKTNIPDKGEAGSWRHGHEI